MGNRLLSVGKRPAFPHPTPVERRTKSRLWKAGIQLTAHALLMADAIFLYRSLETSSSFLEIGIAHAAAILALGLSTFFLSFLKEKNDVASWNFTLNLVASFIVTQIVSLILCGGICLLLFSLHQPFDVHISGKCYAYIYYLCSVLLAPLLFLGLLPRGGQKHNRLPQSSGFLNGILRYLFLPLTAGYLVVLYTYATRILIRWELPTGWVSWLVVALMAVSIGIEFGLYPARFKENKRFDQWTARWLPILVLPLLLLMTAGIARRFNDYGITINRLYLATLNGWFYIVCIGLFITRARRINWIPISFAILFLLTSVLPVNYTNITRRYMQQCLEEEIQATCKEELPMTEAYYQEWLRTLPRKKAVEINDRCMYMSRWFSKKSMAKWFEEDVSFYYEFSHNGNVMEADTTATADNNISSQDSIQALGNDVPETAGIITIPKGYTKFTRMTGNAVSVSKEEYAAGVIPVELYVMGIRYDEIYFDLKTLGALSRQYIMKPASFRCKSEKCVFILTSFRLYYDMEIKLDYEGYLFRK